jgi:hypothetical protein
MGDGGTTPPFLTSELDGGDWLASRPGLFTAGAHWIGSCVGPRAHSLVDILTELSRLPTAVPQLRRLVAGFQPRRPWFEPRSGRVGFVVDKVALGHDSSEYFGFTFQFSFHRLLHIHHHLSSGAGTVGQLAADVPSGLSLTAPQKTKLNYPGSLCR